MTEQEVPAVKEELLHSLDTACRTILGSLSDFLLLSLLLSLEDCPRRSRSLFILPSISVSLLSKRCEYSDCWVSEFARRELRKPKLAYSSRSMLAWYYTARDFLQAQWTSWKLSPRKILGSPAQFSPMLCILKSALIPSSAKMVPNCCSLSRVAARKPPSYALDDLASPSGTYSQSISSDSPLVYFTRSMPTRKGEDSRKTASNLCLSCWKGSPWGAACVIRTTTTWKAGLGPSKGQLSFSAIDIIYFFDILYLLLRHGTYHKRYWQFLEGLWWQGLSNVRDILGMKLMEI